MQTNIRTVASFLGGIIVGIVLTLLLGRYTHTIYFASDYEPLIEEVSEVLEVVIPIMQTNIDEDIHEFKRRVDRGHRGNFFIKPTLSVQKQVSDYLEQSKKTFASSEQIQHLQKQLFTSIDTIKFIERQKKEAIKNVQFVKKANGKLLSLVTQQLIARLQKLAIVVLEKKIVDTFYERFGKELLCSGETDIILIPNSTYLLQGDIFDLEIALASHTTSLTNAELVVDNKKVDSSEDSFFRIRRKCNNVGEQKITGSVIVTNEDSTSKTYPFVYLYTVVKPCR